MASKSKDKGETKEASRIVEGLKSKEDDGDSSPASMNGDLDDGPQLWIHAPEDEDIMNDEVERKKMHNVWERRRKDKIKRWVSHIATLLPPVIQFQTKRDSTLEIMEKASVYIQEMQDKNEKLLMDKGGAQVDEIKKLRKELEDIKSQRDKYADMLKHAGISLLEDPSQWKYSRSQNKPDSTATALDCESSSPALNGTAVVADSSSSKDEETSHKTKSRRKNLVSSHLDNKNNQPPPNQPSVMPGSMMAPNFIANAGMPMMNPMFGGIGQQVLANQNLLMNTAAFQNASMMPGMPNPGPQAGVIMHSGQNTFADKPGAVSSLGLLQLAMQDAGITPTAPSDLSRQTSPVESSSSADVTQTSHAASSSETSTPTSSSHDEHTTSALQTLASVASNTQNAAVGTAGPPASAAPTVTLSQNNIGVTSTTSSVNSIMSLGPPGYTQMMQTGNMMMNMPMMPGQQNAFSMLPNGTMGNLVVNQHGQIIMLNDQGIPVIAGLPNYQAVEEQQVKVSTEKTKSSKKQKQNSVQNSTDSQDNNLCRPPSVSGLAPGQGQPSVLGQQMSQSLQQIHPGQNQQAQMTTGGQMQGNVSVPMGQASGMSQQAQLGAQHAQLPGYPQQMPLINGSGFQTIPLQGQPQASVSGGQQMNQNMLHSLMPNMVGQQPQASSAGAPMPAGTVSAANQGVIPVSQAGNGNLLALNTVPSQPNQLPTALILPNGQIIPVVTNPQPLGGQPNAISSNVHMLPGQSPQIQLQQMPGGQAGPGVLIDPNNPMSAQVVVGPSVQLAPNQQQQLQQQQHNLQQHNLQQQQIQQQMVIQQQLMQQMNMSLMTGTQATPASTTITMASNNLGATASSALNVPGSVQSSIAQSISSVSKVGNQTNGNKAGSGSQKLGKTQSVDPLVNENDVKSQGGKSQGMSQSTESVGLNTQFGQTGINSVIAQPGAGMNPTLLQQGGLNPGLAQQTGVNSAIGQNGTMFNPVTGQTMNPAMGQTASNMNPPISGANLNPPVGHSGAILLNLPVNGQQMNVLVDPVTMQVLGTLPPPQPQAAPAVPTPISTASTVATPLPKRSNKKGHRAICPKPKHGSVAEKDSSVCENPTPTDAVSNWETPNASNTDAAPSVNKEQVDSGENNDNLANNDSTDILAKAAESIFLPPEISPTSGSFYNPANEDNPLHIDTSVGDVDDDVTMSSPSKMVRVPQTSDVAKSAADLVKSPTQMLTQPLPQTLAANELQKCGVTSAPKTHLETTPSIVPVPAPSTPKKSKSRSKSSAKDNSTTDSSKTGGKKSSKKKKDPVPVSEPDTINSLPESITFNESQLSDVLDHLENIGASAVESPPKKSRKGKSSDDEPSSKRRKKNSGKEKEALLKKSHQAKPEGSSKLSVYDFQDSPPDIPSATPPKRTGGSGAGIMHTSDIICPEPVKGASVVNKSGPKKASTTDENIDMFENVLSHLKREQERASKMEQQVKPKPKKKKKSSKDKDKDKTVIQPTVPPVCTSSSSPDNATVISQTIPITQKPDLMENDVSSSMLSPPSNNSAHSQSADTAAISSSGMDSLMELAAPSPILTAVPSIAVSSPAPITTSVLTPSPGLAQSPPVLVPSPELTIPSPPHSSSPGQLLIQSPEFQSPTPGIGLTQSPQSIQNSPSQSMLPSSVSASSPASGSSTPRYQSNFESHIQQPQSSVKLNHMTHIPSVKPQDTLFPHTTTSVTQEQQLPSSVEQSNSIKSPSHQNYLPSTQMNSLSQLSTSPSNSNQTKQPLTHVPQHVSAANSLEANTQMPGIGDQLARPHASPHHQHQQLPQQHSHPQQPHRSMPFQPNLNIGSTVPQTGPIPSPGITSQEPVQTRPDDSSLSRLDTPQTRPMTDSGAIPRMDRLDTAQNRTIGDNSGNIPRIDTVQNRNRVDSRTNSSACSNYQPPPSMPGFSNANSMLSPKEQSFGSPPQLSSTMKLTHLPATGHQSGKSTASIATSDAVQRSRSGIFSAENFVEPSRNGSNLQSHGGSMSRNGTYGRVNNTDPSSDSFNFTSIGLNLTSNSAPNSLPNANSSSSGSTPFSFSLTPVTSTAATTTTSCPTARPSSGSSQVGHHQFPFYPIHPSVSQPAGGSSTSNTSSESQAGQPHPSVNMLGLGMDLRMENSSQNMRQSSRNQMSSQPSFGFGIGDVTNHESPMHDGQRLGMPDKGSTNSFNSSSSGVNQKRHSEMAPNRTVQSSQHMDSSSIQRPPPGNNPANYFTPSFHSSSASLNTPPLHHPPIQTQSSESSQVSVNSRIADNSRINTKTRLPDNPNLHQDTSHLQQDNAHMPESSRLGHMRPNFQPNFPATHQSSMLFGSNRFENDVPFNRGECSNPQPYPQSGNTSSAKTVIPPPSKQKSPSHSAHGLSHPPSAPQNVNTNTSRSHNSNPTMTSSQSSSHAVPHPQQQSTPQPHGRSTKSRKQSKKSSKQTFMEMDTNLSHSIFDSNQGIPPYFQIPSLPPSPSRNLPNEGPFLPGNFFSSGGRPLSNASASMPKNSDLGTPFNSLFSPSRPQNGLGLNFQPAFGMNPGNPGNTSQMPPSGGLAVTPHMSNFSLGNLNFLSDVNVSQCDSLNISPIKFHANSMLPHQPGSDPNGPLQHPHQGPGLYHNRGHPGQSPLMHNSMSINSLLGHNPHGFDTRAMGQPINSSVGPPFHGHGHPGTFAMPPLNFSIHEH